MPVRSSGSDEKRRMNLCAMASDLHTPRPFPTGARLLSSASQRAPQPIRTLPLRSVHTISGLQWVPIGPNILGAHLRRMCFAVAPHCISFGSAFRPQPLCIRPTPAPNSKCVRFTIRLASAPTSVRICSSFGAPQPPHSVHTRSPHGQHFLSYWSASAPHFQSASTANSVRLGSQFGPRSLLM